MPSVVEQQLVPRLNASESIMSGPSGELMPYSHVTRSIANLLDISLLVSS